MSEQTCADLIVDCLIRDGVDTLFGVPGAQTYAFFDALARRRNAIKLYVTRHEQGAAYMAFGYAKSTGKTGVYCVVPGPGLLNSTAALCTAHNTKVMCIAGQVPSAFLDLGHRMLHEIPDQLGLVRHMTKWAGRIDHPDETPGEMSTAFNKLASGRPQPVAVEVPMDVLGQPASVEPGLIPQQTPSYAPIGRQIQAAAASIRAARNPMIMVGSGAIDAGAEILELARLIQAPVVSFRGGRGIVSDDEPYGFNCAEGYKLAADTDLMIGIGSRLELPAFRWQKGRPKSKLLRIDIDPTQMMRLRPDAVVIADARLAVQALLDELRGNYDKPPSREADFIRVKDACRQEIQKVQPQMTYLQIMRDILPRDGFVVEEISQVGFASWFGMPVYEPRHFVTGGFQGNLGFGFQTALGVKVANPDKAVFSITGDGGFMFGVQELATAVQYKIGVIILLFNNNAFGNVRRDQDELYAGQIYGSDLENPDFVALAQSFGAIAYRSASPADFKRLLEQALKDSETGPVLIEVPCEKGSEVSPWDYIFPTGYA